MRLLRAADRAAVPWKNGGGVTCEVAVQPAGASFDDFEWRISMAVVDSDGPFSSFEGVDRILAVLRGRLQLRLPGQTLELSAESAPAMFPGDAAVEASVLAGPVLDVNLMVRRGRTRATLLPRLASLPAPLAVSGEMVVIACGEGVRLANGREALDLEPFDAVVLVDGDGPLMLEAAEPAMIYLATFTSP